MSAPAHQEHGRPLATARCLNCDAMLSGGFCAACGQAADVHVPTTAEIVHDALEGVTHSDSRLWRTLRLLWFHPGRLTQEFVAGRRAAFLPPFRLYLTLSVLFFLVASFSHSVSQTVNLGQTDGQPAEAACRNVQSQLFTSPRWSARALHACEEIVRDRGETLLHIAIGTMPKAMFVFLPLIAFFHMLLYWHPRHRYAEHLLFFIHLQAFFFFVMTLVVLGSDAAAAWPRISSPTGVVNSALMWAMPVYTIIAMQRVFGSGWIRTLFKATALFAIYLVVLAITLGTVFVYAVSQL